MIKRLWPLAIIAAGFAAFFGFGLHEHLTFDVFQKHGAAIKDWVTANPILAPLAFMVVYAASVAFSLPGGLVLTVAGGFLFGLVYGSALVVVAATIGAVAIFLAAKTSLGVQLRERAGPWLSKLEGGFNENAFSYMLVLRLVPLFPFFVVNIVPAFLGVRLSTYSITTLFGIIPGTVVFSAFGAGLDTVIQAGGNIDASTVLTPEIMTALIGLAVMSMIPVVYKAWRKRKTETTA